MKVFISYSRIDAKETANVIHNYLTEYGHHEVFIDTSNIPFGGNWKEVIQKEISNCDIFIIIITPSAFYRSEVEKEVELAKKLKKKIIPCIAKDYVEENEIKWELNNYQVFFYDTDSKLAMDLHMMIKREAKNQRKMSTEVKTLIEKGNILYDQAPYDPDKYQEAIESYDKALKVDPNYVDALNGKGNALYNQGKQDKYKEAIEWYDKALKIDPNYSPPQHNKKSALKRLSKEKIDLFDQMIQIDPYYTLAQK